MARLYADEQFPRIVVKLLRELGHDILKREELRVMGEKAITFTTCETYRSKLSTWRLDKRSPFDSNN